MADSRRDVSFENVGSQVFPPPATDRGDEVLIMILTAGEGSDLFAKKLIGSGNGGCFVSFAHDFITQDSFDRVIKGLTLLTNLDKKFRKEPLPQIISNTDFREEVPGIRIFKASDFLTAKNIKNRLN